MAFFCSVFPVLFCRFSSLVTFYFTLPVFVFSRTVSVFAGPSVRRVCSNVVSFKLQLHRHAGLLQPQPQDIHPCGPTCVSTSLWLYFNLHLRAPWAAAAPPALPLAWALPFLLCKLDPNLKCRATDQAAALDDLGVRTICNKPVRLAFSTRHKKTKSTQQTGRAPWFTIARITHDVTLLAQEVRDQRTISCLPEYLHIFRERKLKRQRPQCFPDLRSVSKHSTQLADNVLQEHEY